MIRFAKPDYGEEEMAAVAEAVRSGWTTSGPRAAALEEEFQSYSGCHHAVAVNSCTAGMHVALTALGIGPGDEVITSPLTFCATVNTISQVGATPVLADVGEDLNISAASIRDCVTAKTKAILPVHMAGLPCDMPEIWAIAREHRLKVVEDAAHAAGAKIGSTHVGAGQSDAVAFSFYATKNVSAGEGGMVTTPDEELARKMRCLALHGISRDAWTRRDDRRPWFYEVVDGGFKYNLSDILAALGSVQLKKLDVANVRRRHIAKQYTKAFCEVPGLTPAPTGADEISHAWHLYILRVDPRIVGCTRDDFIFEMRERGVECSVHFIPIPLHPYYRDMQLRGTWTNALAAFEQIVSLPLYPGLCDSEVRHVVEAVKDIAAVRA